MLVLTQPSLEKLGWDKAEASVPMPRQTDSVDTGRYLMTRKERKVGWSLVPG